MCDGRWMARYRQYKKDIVWKSGIEAWKNDLVIWIHFNDDARSVKGWGGYDATIQNESLWKMEKFLMVCKELTGIERDYVGYL